MCYLLKYSIEIIHTSLRKFDLFIIFAIKKMAERDNSLDIIRSLGLFCIILAHVNPPFTIFQLRNFDVPLMVFISGYLFGNKNQTFKSITDFTSYLWKRFFRLVVPVWIFLSIFYSIQYFFPLSFKINYTQFPDIMISSYLLLDGFGYVWIIRIFLMIAILGPLFTNFIKNKWQLLIYYTIYEMVVQYSTDLFQPDVQKYFNQFGTYSLGFLIFFMLGAQYRNYDIMSKKVLFIISTLISFGGFAYFKFHLGAPFDIGALKYPPHSFYVFYAISIFSIIFYIKPIIQKLNTPILNFIGSSTIWIYLWHILFLFLINFGNWYLNWMAILTISIIATMVQQQLINKAINYFKIPNKQAKQLQIIFCS